jgi:hypothetical protein
VRFSVAGMHAMQSLYVCSLHKHIRELLFIVGGNQKCVYFNLIHFIRLATKLPTSPFLRSLTGRKMTNLPLFQRVSLLAQPSRP